MKACLDHVEDKTTRANHPADTPKQYWRIALYYPFLDHMVMELDSRLLKSEDRFLAQQLLPRFTDNITDNQVEAIATHTTVICCLWKISRGKLLDGAQDAILHLKNRDPIHFVVHWTMSTLLFIPL